MRGFAGSCGGGMRANAGKCVRKTGEIIEPSRTMRLLTLSLMKTSIIWLPFRLDLPVAAAALVDVL